MSRRGGSTPATRRERFIPRERTPSPIDKHGSLYYQYKHTLLSSRPGELFPPTPGSPLPGYGPWQSEHRPLSKHAQSPNHWVNDIPLARKQGGRLPPGPGMRGGIPFDADDYGYGRAHGADFQARGEDVHGDRAGRDWSPRDDDSESMLATAVHPWGDDGYHPPSANRSGRGGTGRRMAPGGGGGGGGGRVPPPLDMDIFSDEGRGPLGGRRVGRSAESPDRELSPRSKQVRVVKRNADHVHVHGEDSDCDCGNAHHHDPPASPQARPPRGQSLRRQKLETTLGATTLGTGAGRAAPPSGLTLTATSKKNTHGMLSPSAHVALGGTMAMSADWGDSGSMMSGPGSPTRKQLEGAMFGPSPPPPHPVHPQEPLKAAGASPLKHREVYGPIPMGNAGVGGALAARKGMYDCGEGQTGAHPLLPWGLGQFYLRDNRDPYTLERMRDAWSGGGDRYAMVGVLPVARGAQIMAARGDELDYNGLPMRFGVPLDGPRVPPDVHVSPVYTLGASNPPIIRM